MNKLLEKYTILTLIGLSFLSRLPQLLSPYLILDGDEAILGLMAKHFWEGKDFPLFFYGQAYGFSFIEMGIISSFYSVFGVTEIALKLAMLSLWTAAILLFYKTLKFIEPEKWTGLAFLITTLFIFSPAFAIWSMKARGGYLTAFLLTHVITYLVFNPNTKDKMGWSFIIGLLLIFIYQSQPLWLAGLFPLLGWYVLKSKGKFKIPLLSIGLGLGFTFFHFAKQNLSHFWIPSIVGIENITWEAILLIPQQVYQNLTGSYSYGKYFEPILVTEILAIALILFILIATVYSVIRFLTNRKGFPLLFILTLSVWGTIGYLILTYGTSPRYELPLSGFVFMWMYLLINQLPTLKFTRIILFIFIGLGAISLFDFKNYHYENKIELSAFIKAIEDKGITHTYCDGGLLQWQIMFYTNERVIARYKPKTDRYPPYVIEVSQAYQNGSNSVAMVGQFKKTDIPNQNGFQAVNKQYYILENPTDTILKTRGFDLTIQ